MSMYKYRVYVSNFNASITTLGAPKLRLKNVSNVLRSFFCFILFIYLFSYFLLVQNFTFCPLAL